ncbi:MAG: hypothetical protein JNK49_18905 [Planctomycetes bacterium]|nr:hypothetical protein [Planctomycetota bacterium]
MRPFTHGVLFTCLGGSLLAQAVTVSLDALTPLQCRVVQGVATAQQTLPVGPLAQFGEVTASLGSPPLIASASLGWSAGSSSTESVVSLTFANQLSGPGSTSIDPGEILVTFTGSSASTFPVRFVADVSVSGAGSSPFVRIDRDNDGSIDWTLGGGVFAGAVADLVTQPLRLRVLCQELRTQAGNQILQLNLRVLPDNGVVVTPIRTDCSGGSTRYSVEPVFDTSLVDVVLQSSRTEWHVLGIAAQPQLLPPALTLTSLPCLLVPSPDWVLRTGTIYLQIPAAVRPITLYSQLALLNTGNGIRVSDAFLVTAR